MAKLVLSGVAGVLIGLAAVLFVVGRGDEPERPYRVPGALPDDPFVTVEKGGLIADIDYYLAIIDEAHADPYRKVTREALRAKAEAVKEHIRNLESPGIPLIRAFFLLQEVAAFIEDEHTSVYYNDNWNRSWPQTFPLELRILDEGVYVLRDRSDAGVPERAELLEIDGRPMADLIAQCWRFTNQTLPHYKRQILEKSFGHLLQALLEIPPPWRIGYRHEGLEQTVELAPLDAEKTSGSTPYEYGESALEVNGRRVPVLDIPRFYSDDRPAYDAFMADFFARHESEPALVIDLRKNPGGDGRWAYAVLDYLTDTPYLTHERFDFRISQPFVDVARFSFEHRLWEEGWPRLLWWLPRSIVGEDYWIDRIEAADVGDVAVEHDAYHTPDPEKSTYRGDVYLLVSHQTNSAAVVFAAIFAYHGMGTIVGRETGGRTLYSSDSISIEMPHSQLYVWVPVAVLALPDSTADRGVVPDVEVEITLDDSRSGHDKDLEKVRELIAHSL